MITLALMVILASGDDGPSNHAEECEGGDVSACVRACKIDRSADACMVWGDAIAKDRKQRGPMINAYELACANGDSRGCSLAATALLEDAAAGDVKRATDLLQKGCEGEDGPACTRLAMLHGEGKLVPKDEKRAFQLYISACDFNDGLACARAADALTAGAHGAPSKDPARATKLYEKGCNRGSVEGCYGFGEALRTGTGVAKDEARAAGLFTVSCEGQRHARACFRLSEMHATGTGAPKDAARARDLRSRACKSGVKEACR